MLPCVPSATAATPPTSQHTLPQTHIILYIPDYAIYLYSETETETPPRGKHRHFHYYFEWSWFFIISRGKATRRLLLYISLCVLFGLRAYNRVNNYPWDWHDQRESFKCCKGSSGRSRSRATSTSDLLTMAKTKATAAAERLRGWQAGSRSW